MALDRFMVVNFGQGANILMCKALAKLEEMFTPQEILYLDSWMIHG